MGTIAKDLFRKQRFGKTYRALASGGRFSGGGYYVGKWHTHTHTGVLLGCEIDSFVVPSRG